MIEIFLILIFYLTGEIFLLDRRLGQLLTIDLLENRRQEIVRKIVAAEDEDIKVAKNIKKLAQKDAKVAKDDQKDAKLGQIDDQKDAKFGQIDDQKDAKLVQIDDQNEPKASAEKQLEEETDESETKLENKFPNVQQLNKIENIDLSEKTDKENTENSKQITTEAIVEKNISE